MTLVAFPSRRQFGLSLGALAASLGLLAATGCSASPPGTGDPTASRLSAALEELGENGFRGIVAVERSGALEVHGVGDGFAGRSDLGDLEVDSGSIVKTFTAAGALTLMAEGKLAATDTLADFFPDAPADKKDITVHQLLTLSSGLPGAVGDDGERASREDLVRLAFTADLLFAPGEGYEYSNVGMSLVAAIIEKVSGQTYEDYLATHVFAPAGMTRTGYWRVYDPEHSMRSAEGQTIAQASWGELNPVSWHLVGNGGMVTTANDMMAFMDAYADGRIVSKALAAEARKPHVKEGEFPSHYGYGMVVEDHPAAGRHYWHNGGNGYFFAQWTDFAEKDTRVFIASLGDDRTSMEAPMRLAMALFPAE